MPLELPEIHVEHSGPAAAVKGPARRIAVRWAKRLLCLRIWL
jgi:hypothetical protein